MTMKSKILMVLSILFGLLFINAGLDKFFHYMPMPDDIPKSMLKVMTAFMEIKWLMPLVGFIEVLGGLLFISGKTRALGAVIIFPIMVGIILTNIFYTPGGLAIALPLFAINLWAMYDNREKLARLFW